jgi:hypothetical protein
MISLCVYDNNFCIYDSDVYRQNKKTKKWLLCNNIKADYSKYIRFKLTNNIGKRKWFSLHKILYLSYNQSYNIYDTSTSNDIIHIDLDRTNNTIQNLKIGDIYTL